MGKEHKLIKRIMIFIIVLTLAFSLIMMYIERRVLPRGAEILHSYAETNMFEILNSTVGQVVEKYSATYSSLVDIKYNSDGDISSLSVDYKMANKLKSEIAMIVSQRLSQQDEIPVYVPIGAFFNNIY